MLKGETFDLQTFTSDAFALFNDRFMNGQCGVMKGCALSNTNTSATIGAGYFLIKGRFLRIISSETVSGISTDGYYSLICEIDLTKTNTTSVFNQGVIKVVSGAGDYPTLTQQDLTDSGTLYQYEFARFRVSDGNITNFADRRTYVDYGTILTLIQTELANLENLSNVSLKSDFAVLTGTITTPQADSGSLDGTVSLNYPTGFSQSNCVVVNLMSYKVANRGWNTTGAIGNSVALPKGNYNLQASLRESEIIVLASKISDTEASDNINIKVVLMKIS